MATLKLKLMENPTDANCKLDSVFLMALLCAQNFYDDNNAKQDKKKRTKKASYQVIDSIC